MSVILEAVDISKKLGGVWRLYNINISIEKGDIVGVIGPSGAGKTVFLKTISGFYEPETGTVNINSMDLFKNKQAQRNIGFSTQNYSFYPDLSIEDNLFYFGKIFGIKKSVIKSRIDGLLETVGLPGNKKMKAKHLSGGMQRRLDIACALIHDPDILILDEPIANLDPILREKIIKLVQDINKNGKTIIISSHFMNDIEGICKKLFIIKDGYALVFGTPKIIRDEYSNIFELAIRTYPGNYNKLISYIQKFDIEIKNKFIKNNYLYIHLSKKRRPITYLKLIFDSLNNTNEELLGINLSTLSIDELFGEIIKK